MRTVVAFALVIACLWVFTLWSTVEDVFSSEVRVSATSVVHASVGVPGVAPSAIARAETMARQPETLPRVGETGPTKRPSLSTWDALADCESGSWNANHVPIPGSADWASMSDGYEGGVHFTADTWVRAGGLRYAARAFLATRAQQIDVAKSWLARTSVTQWPKCGPMVGLTMEDAR